MVRSGKDSLCPIFTMIRAEQMKRQALGLFLDMITKRDPTLVDWIRLLVKNHTKVEIKIVRRALHKARGGHLSELLHMVRQASNITEEDKALIIQVFNLLN